MSKSIRLAMAGAVLAAAVSLTATASAATSANATATAEILSSIDITKDLDLDFAQIAVNGAGTVVVGTGAAASSCSANLVCAGTKQAASFTVTGAKNIGVTASVAQSSITLSDGGTNTMTVDSFTLYFPSGTTLIGAAASATGTTTVDVGGTLHVAAGQATGVYSGNFDVNVAYN